MPCFPTPNHQPPAAPKIVPAHKILRKEVLVFLVGCRKEGGPPQETRVSPISGVASVCCVIYAGAPSREWLCGFPRASDNFRSQDSRAKSGDTLQNSEAMAGCCLLFVVCCLLFVACCLLLFVACCLLLVVCCVLCLLFVVCLFVCCCLLFVVCCLFACCLLCVVVCCLLFVVCC